MEILDPLMPSFSEMVVFFTTGWASIAVFIASYRRNRLLFDKSVLVSLLIAWISATFILIWLIVWLVNRQDIAARWEYYRTTKRKRNLTPV